MIKLIATDLDGTLLAKPHVFDETIFSCVNKVVESGTIFSIATGRSVQRSTVKEFIGKAYNICMNGALILDPNQNVLRSSPVEKNLVHDLMHSFPDIHFQYVTPETTLCSYSLEDHLHISLNPEYVLKDLSSSFTYDQTEEAILSQDIYKINIYIEKDRSFSDLEHFLELHSDKLVNAPCSKELFEITKAGVNKGTAVQWLANHLGIQEDEVAVYGDGGNDIAMLSMFEHSYSPSDAFPQAIKVAKTILGPHDEYSVTKHMLETISK